MFKLSPAVLSGIALFVGAVQPATAATKAFYVGTCKPGKADFTTIQEAVSGVPPGSTINVCPGVYPEQVTITQQLTLQGVQSGNNAQVIITAPAGGTLVATVPVAVPIFAQVAVQNSGGEVNISGLTIDGTGIIGTTTPTTGVLYNSSPGTLNQVVIQNLAPFPSGPVGITFRDDFAVSPTDIVQNSSIAFPFVSGLSNASIGIAAATIINGAGQVLSGGTITLTVSNNYISAENAGLDLENSVAATVTGNALAGVAFSNAPVFAFEGVGVAMLKTSAAIKISNNSILDFGDGVQLAAPMATSTTTVSNNSIASSDSGVNVIDSAGIVTINGNQLITPSSITAPSARLGFNFNCGAPLPIVAGNTIVGAQIGFANVPSGLSLQKNAGTSINVPSVETLCQ